MAPTVTWRDGAIELIDQTRLPDDEVVLRLTDVDGVIEAIARLAVRGAPAIGVAGGFGVALAARGEADRVAERVALLRAARPTAVNLARVVDRVAARLPDGPDAVLAEALAVHDEEAAASWAMGRRGADLVAELVARRPVRAVTICNTGALATVGRGTALAVVFELADRGQLGEVLALETRPLLQGARLTAWELARAGIAHRLCVDGAAAGLLAGGVVDVALVGADRIAADGSVANKVGTLGLALAARHAGIPFIVVAPESTVDESTPDGASIAVEERGPEEITHLAGRPTAPTGTAARNPAFDVTPPELVSAVVTDRRVWRPGPAAG